MTGNAQIDHRKYFIFFTLTTAGGQFESLQGVKYPNVKVPNLVYFGSPSIALFNGNRTISRYDQILLIFLIRAVTPIFALKGSVFRHQT